jgi:hypothetical protein
MKRAAIIIFLLTVLIKGAESQTNRINSNVWYSNEKLSGSEIWINTDSTYFLTYSGCIETSVTKGKWTHNADTFFFSPSFNFELYPTIDFVKSDRFELTFLDFNNLPIEGLKVTFDGDTSKVYQTVTNEKGKIILTSAIYNSIYFDGLQNKYLENSKKDSSFVVQIALNRGIGAYVLKFNYPKSIIENEQLVDNFHSSKELQIYRTGKNELIESTYERKYRKKY